MLNELQKEVADVVTKRFPLNNYTSTERFIAVTTQIGELGDLLLIKKGIKNNHKNQHNSCNESLAAVLIDLLVLSQQLDVDLDKEIQKAICWFKKGATDVSLPSSNP